MVEGQHLTPTPPPPSTYITLPFPPTPTPSISLAQSLAPPSLPSYPPLIPPLELGFSCPSCQFLRPVGVMEGGGFKEEQGTRWVMWTLARCTSSQKSKCKSLVTKRAKTVDQYYIGLFIYLFIYLFIQLCVTFLSYYRYFVLFDRRNQECLTSYHSLTQHFLLS